MKRPPTHYFRCPECQAEFPASASSCWLCHRPLGKSDEIHMLYPEAIAESSTRAESVFAWLTVATGALVVLFLLGSFRSHPGMALGVALCTGPALLSNALLIYSRQANGKPFSWQSTFAMFAGSLSLIAIVLASVVAVVSMMVASFLASVGGVCTICAPPAKQQGSETAPLESRRWD